MRALSLLLSLFLISSVVVCPIETATASPGNGLKIVGPRGETTPVVNERGRLALKVVDAAGEEVAVQSWSSDNKSIGKVSRGGMLRGKAFGFATVTAETARGSVKGFVVVARVRRQRGAMARGDTKADTGGNVYLSSPQQHVVYRSDGFSADVFAGSVGQAGYTEATGTSARFDGPAGLGVDNRAEGGIYVADTANHCIRKIDFRGRSSLAVGTPQLAGTMRGDETPMSEAVMKAPRGVASVGSNLFVTDTENHCLWYVDTQRQRVQLIAGNPGESGLENGQGRAALFNRPSGIAINTRGNLLAVADTGNNVIRLIGIAPREGGGIVGEVTTLGLGSSARNAEILARLRDDRGEDMLTFEAPESVAFDGVDNVYVIDQQTASVVTRPAAGSGRPVERVELAQVGTLGDPASVTVRRTQAFVLDEAATSDSTAVNVVEVGAPTIADLSEDEDQLGGGKVITITGTNFAPESRLTLGDAEVTDISVVSSRQITFTVPPQQAPGTRTLTVTTRGGVAQHKFQIFSRPLSELLPGQVTTVAGGLRYVGDGATATDASVSLLFPGDVALDSAGNLFVADTNNHRVRRVDGITGIITTVAGTGAPGFSGDGGPASAAALYAPRSVAVDRAGDLLIADSNNGRVRKVHLVTGVITTVAAVGCSEVEVDARGDVYVVDAGNGRIRKIDGVTQQISIVAGNGELFFNGDGIPATQAALSPHDVAIDEAGNLFIVDANQYGVRIRRVDAETGRISTYAGTGEHGNSGDGGAATNARIGAEGITFDVSGNLIVVGFSSIRRVDAQSGIISTIAGTGTTGFGGDGGPATLARFEAAADAVVTATGDLVIDDSYNHRIRRVDASTQTIRTVVGNDIVRYGGDGGPASRAVLGSADDVAVDEDGDLVIADYINSRVREVDALTGEITTIAGSGDFEFNGDGVPALEAALVPAGLAFDRSGNLLVADYYNDRLRRIDRSTRTVTTIAGGGTANPAAGGLATEARLNGLLKVAVGPDDEIYVSTQSDSVFRIDPVSGHIALVDSNLEYPDGLAVDGAGNLFIADTNGNTVKRVDAATGLVTTAFSVDAPHGLVFDAAGNLFVSSYNGFVARVNLATGAVTLVAGVGRLGYRGDEGPALDAEIGSTFGITFDSAGNLYLADVLNNVVRAVKSAGAPRL